MNSITDKIKKLLALSKSANEHEAASAAAMAAALMVEHHISEVTFDDVSTNDDLGSFCIDRGGHRKVTWKGDLLGGAASAFGCNWYWHGSNLHIVGHSSDVDAIKYTYQYLVREVNRLAEKSWKAFYLQEFETARGYKTSFRRGASMTIRKRLMESRRETLNKEKKDADAARASAIVRVENRDQEVKDFFRDMSKGFKKLKTTNTVKSIYGLKAGEQAGKDISLGGGKGLGGGSAKLAAPQRRLGK